MPQAGAGKCATTLALDEACVLQTVASMAETRRPEWRLFDEEKLLLVREFLRREFRDFEHRDYVEFHPLAQVFVLEAEGRLRQMLVIPHATFDVADFAALCNVMLVDALKAARDERVTLTPDGPDVHA